MPVNTMTTATNGYQWWIRPVAGCHAYRAWSRNKQATARFMRLMLKAMDQFSFSIDQCRVKGDRAHLAGEIETEMGPLSLSVTDLIKEDGHWKWYGNQQTDSKN